MTTTRQGHNLGRYLVGMTAVMILLVFCGCAAPLPSLTISPPVERLDFDGDRPSTVDVGRFIADLPEHDAYAEYLSDYLGKLIAEKSGDTDKTDQEPALVVDGRVALRELPDPSDNTRTTTRVNVVFRLSERRTGRLLSSARRSDASADADSKAVRAVLKELADSFVELLYPKEQPVVCSLARGRSKLDRQGRDCAARGDYPRAMLFFQRAIDAHPNDHAALYNAALVCEALGDYPRALRYYRRALKLAKDESYKSSYERVKNILGGK